MQVGSVSRRAAGALGIVVLAAGAAHAGGFAVREQSAYGLGSSYAGVAAGGSLSSMFWNPATMTQVPGLQSESVLTGVLPYAKNTVGSGSTLAPFGYGGTDNIGIDALVPAGYNSWQVTRDVWLGLSMNSPFGLSEHFPNNFAGRDYAGDSSLKTYNFTPSIAYRVNDWLSLGAGVQIQYMSVNTDTGIGPLAPGPFPFPGLAPSIGNLKGAGWGYGFTVGATLKPTATTTIGVGYRSAINQDINGTLGVPANVLALAPFGLPSTPGSVHSTINLPATLSVGLRQQLGPQWTLLGTLEWSNWSRIGTANILQPNGTQAVVLGRPSAIHFEYRDGWFASLGAEYKWSDALALRAGIGFERSPISDDVRVPLLPDNDRTWASIGATWNVTPRLALDFAYAHLFVKDAPITVSSTANPSYNGVIAYNGTVDAHIDLISVGLKYRFDTPVAPVKLITKG